MTSITIFRTRLRWSPGYRRHGAATALGIGALGILAATVLPVSVDLPDASIAWATLACAGLVSGFLAGLLGIGGALITVPSLYLALPQLGTTEAALPQAVVACALLAMIPTTLAAARSHHRHGTIDAAWLRRMAPPMAFGAVIGATLTLQLRGPVLALAFAAQTLWYGASLICGGSRDRPGPVARWMSERPPWIAGSVFAAFCACVGMGGGSLVTPYLASHRLSLKSAVATASVLNLCIALGGTLTFALGAAISTTGLAARHWAAATAIAGFAIVSVPWGVKVAVRLSIRRFSLAVGAMSVFGGLALTGQVALSARTTPPLAHAAPVRLPAPKSVVTVPVTASRSELPGNAGSSRLARREAHAPAQ